MQQEQAKPMIELFAGELRRARTGAGLTQEALAKTISFSDSLVAMVEQCRRLPSLDFTRRCDEALNTDGLLERIREAVTSAALLPWFREWAAIEHEATVIRSFQPVVLPGLLQTEEYARALFEGGSRFTAQVVEEQVHARMHRQQIFARELPPWAVFVVDEAALRRQVGTRDVMCDQLRRLLDVASSKRTEVQVVPSSVGPYPGVLGGFVIAKQPEGGEVGYVENQIRGVLVAREADVRELRDTWDSIRAEALPTAQSITLIEEVLATWS